MARFPFPEVVSFMEKVNWKWGISSTITPNVEELQKTANRILYEATKDWDGSKEYHMRVSTGGLEALIMYGELSLRFIPYQTSDYRQMLT